MPIFDLPQWREPRGRSTRRNRRYEDALPIVACQVERLELRELLDGMPIISISDVTVDEGNPDQVTQANFVVTLSETSPIDVTASFITQNGTANSSASISNGLQSDFNDASGTVTIPAGETTGNIQVAIVGDNQVETNETFSVVLSDPSGATFGEGVDSLTANATITDDENPGSPSLSVSSPTIIEGNSRTQNVQVIVSVSPTSLNDITYTFMTANGTATDPSDYQAQNGNRIIHAGQSSDTINIPIVGDRSAEPNESFFVVIQSVTNANVSNPTGTVTIRDGDSGRPTLNVGAATTTESDAGTSSLDFPITLSAPSNFDIVINVSMKDGSALAGRDYVGTTITHTIPAGVATDSIAVPIIGDLVHESTESFSIRVAASHGSNVTVGSKRVIVTITDNDPVPTIIIQPSVTVSEADSAARFTVSLSNPTSEQVAIDFNFVSVTARSRRDYNVRQTRLIFAPGQVNGSVSIAIVNDITVEPTETFTYTITNATNAIIDALASSGVVTINDNDHP